MTYYLSRVSIVLYIDPVTNLLKLKDLTMLKDCDVKRLSEEERCMLKSPAIKQV